MKYYGFCRSTYSDVPIENNVPLFVKILIMYHFLWPENEVTAFK